MARLKPGTRLRSVVCETEVMVIGAPDRDVAVTCGGAPMIDGNAQPPAGGAVDPAAAEGTQLGKRYVNEPGDVELLCSKPGQGSLGVDGAALRIKGAKPLPSSD